MRKKIFYLIVFIILLLAGCSNGAMYNNDNNNETPNHDIGTEVEDDIPDIETIPLNLDEESSNFIESMGYKDLFLIADNKDAAINDSRQKAFPNIGSIIANLLKNLDKKWPANLDVEIESKWMMDEATYQKIVKAFPDNGSKYGYTINVRWGGVPKKYVDVYYDNNARVLKNAKHSIRRRKRYEASSYLPKNPSLSQLQNANWSFDWQRVQYKSTPSIISPIWFRDEVTTNVSSTSQAMDIVYGRNTSSAAYKRLKQDHSNYNFSTMKARSYVYDYRYRIELQKNGVPVYEISLDRVQIRYKFLFWWRTKNFTECEMEVLKSPRTRRDITMLYLISKNLENEFELTPSTKAKGQY